ncbi:MAG: thiol:disulfide interchange protein DsbA/DsbL [Candidatus Accumulibacter sp.]|jgi:thiol:disulfide interchange protein DsbA|nr:thiol:disulfide interchange protein DsbA/DsbL [Accumulibacter sp.]
MKKYPGIWLFTLLAGLCLLSLPAQAQPVAGRDYKLIEPAQPTDDPGRIEVIEFFSYACPHCNDLNPLIQKWVKDLPRDVFFKRVPVNYNPFYELMAKLFYTLDTTGDMARLDAELFAAIHEKGLRLVSEKNISEWAVSQGVDARRFSEAWNSFSVSSKMKRADQIARGHRIQGVPAIVVDGRYQVTSASLLDLPQTTDQVIALRRAERSAAPAAPK